MQNKCYTNVKGYFGILLYINKLIYPNLVFIIILSINKHNQF